MNRTSRLLLPPSPPSWRSGLAAGLIAVTGITGLLYGLREIAPVLSLGVVYLLAVIVVSIVWGLRLGLVTALASSVAFNFFHIPPTGRLTIANSENWVALVVFFIVAVIASSLADLARSRTTEAEARRREADLMAEMAQILLGGTSVDATLPTAARRLAAALDLRSASIERDGTVTVPDDIDPAMAERLHTRITPAVRALLAAAIEREELMGAAVETEALRRSDEIKTALLRTVSHDLRSPITAIRAASEALASPSIDAEDRAELEAAIASDAERLSRLVENLLTMSSLRTGAAEPRWDWCSVEELIEAAADDVDERPELELDRDLPLIRGDAAQLERAFANLLGNALRYAGPENVSITAHEVSGRIVVSIADRGPGIPAAELDRVFEPFYRGDANGSDSHPGSGLGLAIVKGFVEANGGAVHAESLPGQGTTFVVELPIPAEAAQ